MNTAVLYEVLHNVSTLIHMEFSTFVDNREFYFHESRFHKRIIIRNPFVYRLYVLWRNENSSPQECGKLCVQWSIYHEILASFDQRYKAV